MSTEFITIPSIPYDDFLKSEKLIFILPNKQMYVNRHTLISSPKYEGTLWAYENEKGNVEFERFGKQNENILQEVIDEFHVKIFDEYGIKWP